MVGLVGGAMRSRRCRQAQYIRRFTEKYGDPGPLDMAPGAIAIIYPLAILPQKRGSFDDRKETGTPEGLQK